MYAAPEVLHAESSPSLLGFFCKEVEACDFRPGHRRDPWSFCTAAGWEGRGVESGLPGLLPAGQSGLLRGLPRPHRAPDAALSPECQGPGNLGSLMIF